MNEPLEADQPINVALIIQSEIGIEIEKFCCLDIKTNPTGMFRAKIVEVCILNGIGPFDSDLDFDEGGSNGIRGISGGTDA